jgi:hypothetical protein
MAARPPRPRRDALRRPRRFPRRRRVLALVRRGVRAKPAVACGRDGRLGRPRPRSHHDRRHAQMHDRPTRPQPATPRRGPAGAARRAGTSEARAGGGGYAPRYLMLDTAMRPVASEARFKSSRWCRYRLRVRVGVGPWVAACRPRGKAVEVDPPAVAVVFALCTVHSGRCVHESAHERPARGARNDTHTTTAARPGQEVSDLWVTGPPMVRASPTRGRVRAAVGHCHLLVDHAQPSWCRRPKNGSTDSSVGWVGRAGWVGGRRG